MKTTYVPKELLNLPSPWGMTHGMSRLAVIRRLSDNPSQVKKALNVLERCLSALLQLDISPSDSLPADMMEYWDFSASYLARKMPALDKFEMLKVQEFLVQYGINEPSETLTFDVASYWLCWVTRDIYRATLSWLRDALREAGDSPQATRFLRIVRRYYWQVDESIKQSLLLASASIGWQKALPLLKSIEHNYSTCPQLRQAAQDYQQWILGPEGKTKAVVRQTPQFVLTMAGAGD